MLVDRLQQLIITSVLIPAADSTSDIPLQPPPATASPVVSDFKLTIPEEPATTTTTTAEDQSITTQTQPSQPDVDTAIKWAMT